VRSPSVLSTEDDMADETSVVDLRPSTKRVGVRTRSKFTAPECHL
jgi:hypothetical protein